MILHVLVPAIGITLILSGCAASSGLALGQYGGLSGSAVSTSCGGGYRVASHPSETKLLVTPYFGSALYQAVCEGASSRPDEQTITGVPFEEGAREYLISNRKRPDCIITSGTRLTPLHSEFTYSCPS